MTDKEIPKYSDFINERYVSDSSIVASIITNRLRKVTKLPKLVCFFNEKTNLISDSKVEVVENALKIHYNVSDDKKTCSYSYEPV